MAEYERIEGKLYRLVDEGELNAKISNLYESLLNCAEGIKTCDNYIKAYQEQKERYTQEIDKAISAQGLDKNIIKQVAPDKASLLGF